jgi:hypothetical protein
MGWQVVKSCLPVAIEMGKGLVRIDPWFISI